MPPTRRRDLQRTTKADVEQTRVEERYRLYRLVALWVIAAPLMILAFSVLVSQFADVATAIAGQDTNFKFDLVTNVSLAVSGTLILGGGGWAAQRMRTQTKTTTKLRNTQQELQKQLDAAEDELARLKGPSQARRRAP